MTTIRALKKLLLGETWTLPAGILVSTVVAAAFTGRLTGFILLAGVLATLLAGVGRTARRR
jgi:hypothetical protein